VSFVESIRDLNEKLRRSIEKGEALSLQESSQCREMESKSLEIARLNKELNMTISELYALRVTNDKLKSDFDTNRDKLESTTSILYSLESERTGDKEELSSLRAKCALLQLDCEEASRAIEKSESALVSLREDLSTSNESLRISCEKLLGAYKKHESDEGKQASYFFLIFHITSV